MDYISVIKTSFFLFPFLAFLITMPYILKEYHKYGSVYWFRVLIVYSFILYLLTSFFLVILPLPSIEEVAKLTTPTTQLIPFSFVVDFIKELAKITNVMSLFKLSSFYVPIFNLFLFLPFGIYLRYYFKYDLKKTVICSFLVSLFFEITQLTGLFYLYPRGYRLFDIDDLIINTLGGITGYFAAYLFMKFLPSRDDIDLKALKLGEKLTLLRRSLLFIMDITIFLIINFLARIIIDNNLITLIVLICYYIVIPSINHGKTIIGSFLNVKISNSKEKNLKLYQIVLRQILFFGYIDLIPLLILLEKNITINISIIKMIVLLSYFVVLFKVILNKEVFYEKISHTKLVSTINYQKVK